MTKASTYQICSRCILDTKDYPEISFDENGVCNVCKTFDDLKKRTVFAGEEGKYKLDQLIDSIKVSGKGKEYDCVLAISGGADSSYLAYLCRQWGLNPIALHVDNGWNSELAVKNIENTVNKLGFDLFTFVIDWEELRDLQRAYLKSSVVDLDIPSENALLGAFFQTARKFKVKYILTGHNTMTEGWLPPNFTSQYKLDTMNLRAIQKRFGTVRLRKYPAIGFFRHFLFTRMMSIRMVNPLNYTEYNKENVKKILTEKLQWRDYGGKHFENVFTRFYQGYILPEKYGIDKRKSHYSTLVCSGQITREEALKEILKPPYKSNELLYSDREFFLKKLGMTESDFDFFMQQEVVPHSAFSSYLTWHSRLKPVYLTGRKLGLFRRPF